MSTVAERREEKRRQKEDAKLRIKRAQWTLFLRDGWAMFTACKDCGEIHYCRGKARENMRCETCFLST
jgi:ribosomal protein S27E